MMLLLLMVVDFNDVFFINVPFLHPSRKRRKKKRVKKTHVTNGVLKKPILPVMLIMAVSAIQTLMKAKWSRMAAFSVLVSLM